MLTEYLEKNKILLEFRALDFKQLLKRMLKLSEERNCGSLIKKIIERERLMSTALGKGVALPRVVLENKAKTEIIIAVSKRGVNLTASDLVPVKIIFLFLFSKKDDYSLLLAESLRMLNDDTLRSEILNVKSAEELIQKIKKWEER
ncbi:MAG TPA: PTS sugar transporter subunit IIA [Thermoplasmata archaeon]|nr:PTS sugar transporter subunit IIA [Thermoplasmata archaeon]